MESADCSWVRPAPGHIELIEDTDAAQWTSALPKSIKDKTPVPKPLTYAEDGIENRGISCSYSCLDISFTAVQREISRLSQLKVVQVCGICGTFAAGLGYLERVPVQRVAMWMGSTFFSDTKPAVNVNVRTCEYLFRQAKKDFMILGQDCHTMSDEPKIEASYHNKSFNLFIQSATERINTNTQY